MNAAAPTLMRSLVRPCALALSLVALATPAHASLTLTDGPSGVTCRYLAAGGKMKWQREGGDWLDADGVAFGSRSYARADVPVGRESQTIQWDITTLVRKWLKEGAASGPIFLSAEPAGERGSVDFRSREEKDAERRPTLVLTFADGPSTRVVAGADSSLNCSTSKSTGRSSKLKVGTGQSAIVVFPIPSRPRGELVRAELVLVSDKQYRRGASVAVFETLLPWNAGEGVEDGIAAKFVGDRGIEKHPSVVFVDRFDSASWASRWSSVTKGSTTSRTAANWDGAINGEALKVTVPKGKTNGLNGNIRFGELLGAEPESMYFRYSLKFSNDWDPHLSGGKLPGFAGTYNRAGWGGRKANGKNGWSARGAFFKWKPDPVRTDHYRGIGSYVYHAGMKGDYGSQWGWNLGKTGMLEKNRWYSVEQHVKLNTPGRADGVLQAWVDGELVFERTDLRYRHVSDLKIETLWMNVYHGGTTPAPQDMSLFIDNLVIAREYIGPFRAGR